MQTKRDVFRAIADPTRREILSLLARQSQNVNSISQNFEVSRQAISLHIKILQECNMITIRELGRERICEAKLDQLNEVTAWTQELQGFWTQKLSALKEFVEKENPSVHLSSQKNSASE